MTGTPYGQVSLAKIVLVSAALALGGFNRFVVVPNVNADSLSIARGRVALSGSPHRFFVGAGRDLGGDLRDACGRGAECQRIADERRLARIPTSINFPSDVRGRFGNGGFARRD